MSDTSTLAELAKFVGRSQLGGRDARTAPLSHGAAVPVARPQRASVGELLGVVMALSARTRRLILPRVEIDLDVFAPGGRRAVKLLLPQPAHRDSD